MIALRNVTQTVGKGSRTKELLSGANFVFSDEHIGLIVDSTENAEVVLDLLSGIRRPQSGKIWRSGRVSWPIGRIAQYRADLTGKATLHFLASIYDLPFKRCEDLLFGLMDIENNYNKPLINWPRDLLLQFGYATALMPNFEIYIVDSSINTTNEVFMEDWENIFREKITARQLIYFSSAERYLEKYTTRGVALIEGNFFMFEDLSTAFKAVGPINTNAHGTITSGNEDDTNGTLGDFGI